MEAMMISVTVQYPVRQCWVVAKPCRSAFNDVCCVSLSHSYYIIVGASRTCSHSQIQAECYWAVASEPWIHFGYLSPGVLCKVELEPGPALVKPSQTVSLTCAVTGYSISIDYWWIGFTSPQGRVYL
jgi:hypothetical protein